MNVLLWNENEIMERQMNEKQIHECIRDGFTVQIVTDDLNALESIYDFYLEKRDNAKEQLDNFISYGLYNEAKECIDKIEEINNSISQIMDKMAMY